MDTGSVSGTTLEELSGHTHGAPTLALPPNTITEAIPLNAWAPEERNFADMAADQWMFEFAEVVASFVKQRIPARIPVVPALPPVVVSGHPLASIPTYDTNPNSPPGYWLPFHQGQLGDLYGVDVWHSVYHCRKVFAPSPRLHPDHPWPSATPVWVGSDGVLIC